MSLFKRSKSQPEAFALLYDEYVGATYQYLLRRLQHVENAEDLTSRVWEKVLRKIHTLRNETKEGFCAWLFTIARNELNQHFKHRKKHATQELPEILEDQAKGPVALFRQNAQAQELHRLLAVLPVQQRETVELRYFAELKNKEIAQILGVSQKTVASNLSRALKTLKGRLEKIH